MGDTTHVRMYKADKEKIAELADEDRDWPSKMQEIVNKAYAWETRGSDKL